MPSHPLSSSFSDGETVVCCRWQIAKNHVSTNNSAVDEDERDPMATDTKQNTKDGKVHTTGTVSVIIKALLAKHAVVFHVNVNQKSNHKLKSLKHSLFLQGGLT